MCDADGLAVHTHESSFRFAALRDAAYFAVKRVIDVAVSLSVLVILSPLLLALAALIKLSTPGPVIHKRKCVSKNGPYLMYKFRTMVADAWNLEKYLTPAQIEEYRRNIKVENDPRITKIGKLLRKTSLDEIPQLINVLKGEMSLVGPRPVAVEETGLYGDRLGEVLSVKPGITGYWQTHGRNCANYGSGKRQALELYYVRNRSFLLDMKIILKTFVVVLKKEGAE